MLLANQHSEFFAAQLALHAKFAQHIFSQICFKKQEQQLRQVQYRLKGTNCKHPALNLR